MPVTPRIRAVSVTAAVATALTLGVTGVAYASDDSGPEPCVRSDGGGVLALAADVADVVGLRLDVLGGRDSVACAPKPATKDDSHDDKRTFRDKDCDDFDSQADAQAVLDENKDDPHNLDRDGDGKACESLLDDDDASNDDDSDGSDDKDGSDDGSSDDGGDSQVKVHPKGGVDTGGFPTA